MLSEKLVGIAFLPTTTTTWLSTDEEEISVLEKFNKSYYYLFKVSL